MSVYFRLFIASGLLTVLLVAGCADGELLTPEPPNDIDNTPDPSWHEEGILSRFRFTGRDSFGVAFKARVSGTWSEDEQCKILTGTGNATHLGQIDVEQSICGAGPEITGGSFRIAGRTGGEVVGMYLPGGTLTEKGESFSITAKDTITGGTIQATPVEIEAGKATMTGMLHGDGHFTYQIDGWLLHHVRADVGR